MANSRLGGGVNDPARAVDFDGGGKRDIAGWRPSESTCYVIRSSDGAWTTITLPTADANKGGLALPGDYDADGKTDCAVFRPGTTPDAAHWLWRRSRDNVLVDEQFGSVGDVPLPGLRFNSNPVAFLTLYRPSTGTWIIKEVGATNYFT